MKDRRPTHNRRAPRGVFRPRVEELEDRTVPHGNISQFTEGLTVAAQPAGIVFGADGNLWFTEFAADKIGRVSPVGGPITEFAVPGAGSGPLNITRGNDGALWFTQNGSDQIGRLDPNTGAVTEFAVPGANSQPNDITVGPDGALWFTQTGSDQIGRLDPNTGAISEFVVPGAGSAPAGIAAGPDGAVWFTQAGAGQIGRLDLAGQFTEYTIPVTAGGVSDPEDIVAGPAGALYFTDFGRDQIGRITTSGQITQFNLAVGRGPNQIAAAPDGNLYFTMSASSRIGKLPASALAAGRPTSGTPPLEEFDFIARDSVPLGIAMGGETGSEDIFFTLNAGNAVATFAAHLAQITVATTGPLARVYDINLNQVREFAPFPGFAGELSVTVQDFGGLHIQGPGNGVPDAAIGVAAGGMAAVRIFDGSDNSVLAQFLAFSPLYTGGVTLASDDVNGDGRADLVVAAGPLVKVLDGYKLNQVGSDGVISDGAVLGQFLAFPLGFSSRVSVAVGDINRDGMADIVIGAGAGAFPVVRVVDGAKIGQVGPTGVIADGAILGQFFAFDPAYRGGVNVAVAFNITQRDIVVGAASNAFAAVREIDSSRMGQLKPTGEIDDGAVIGQFLAFTPLFTGGVSVAADDLNNDGVADVIISAGRGGGPALRVVDGTKLNRVQATGEIADDALFNGFITADPRFGGGVNVAADADHRDGTIFGAPGVTVSRSRVDINDMFIFQSPVTATNTVIAMDVSPFSTAATPAAFVPGVLYDFRISNRDLVSASDDLTFRMTFGPPDAAAGGRQDVTVRALPAARFAGSGGVVVKGFTGQNVAARGVGGGGTAQFRAAEQDDPFFFDVSAFSRFLNGGGLSNGSTADAQAGKYPSGTSNGGTGDSDADTLGFDPGETPNYNGTNFFGNSNTLSIVFELPSTVLAGVRPGTALAPDQNPIGFWGRTEANGVQVDRMGRPAINTALVPAVPRGSNFPPDGSALNRIDVRNAFNTGHPGNDRTNFGPGVTSVLAAVYPIGANGQAATVASLLLPDILVYDPTSSAGFFGDTVGTLGQADFFLAGGRKFSDDIISTELAVLTDPDTPFNLDGGDDMAPLVATQNVADDNGMNLTDGSLVGPGTALAGTRRAAVFPYIGAPNANPSGVPGGNPPQ